LVTQTQRPELRTQALCGGSLDDDGLGGLEQLVRDQIMSMMTTFTPGHYRQCVGKAAGRRLLFDAA
jgi:hypothetical protein